MQGYDRTLKLLKEANGLIDNLTNNDTRTGTEI